MVIHRLTNQTVGSGTYLQESTYEGNVEGNHEGTKCWRKSWAVQRGSQGKAWAVLDLSSLNGHLGILLICPEISDGLELTEKHLHTYAKEWDVVRKINISATFPQHRGLSVRHAAFLIQQMAQRGQKMTNRMLKWGKWSLLMLLWTASPGWNISLLLMVHVGMEGVAPSAG